MIIRSLVCYFFEHYSRMSTVNLYSISLFRHGWSDRSTSTMVSLDAWFVGRFMIVVSALISVALLVVYQNKSSEMPKKT